MKKSKLFLLLALSLVFYGCNTNSGETSSSNISEDVSSESYLPSISETHSVKKDEMYHSTSWDENLLNVISCITGEDQVHSVPEASATEYYYYFTIDEASGLDLVVINCHGVNENTAIENYQKALEHASFTLSYENPYGYKEFSDTKDLVVQYDLVTKNNQTYLELLVYMTEFRVKDWPEETIKTYMGETFPAVDARSYEVYQDYTIDYKVRLNICAYHVNINDVSEYTSILTNAGFIMDASTTTNFYEVVSPKGNLHIQYSLFEDTLYIYVYNDYPYALIYSTLGFALPEYEEENVTFDYSFVEVSKDEFVLTLYYNNSSSTALETYGASLTNIGFKQIGEENNYTTESGFIITQRDYIYKQDTENEHYISLMYESTSKSFAVAIYY